MSTIAVANRDKPPTFERLYGGESVHADVEVERGQMSSLRNVTEDDVDGHVSHHPVYELLRTSHSPYINFNVFNHNDNAGPCRHSVTSKYPSNFFDLYTASLCLFDAE